MSHFSVLVVTDADPREPGVLDAALQPYHEYECTGVEDQYVVDVDVTAKYRERYETAQHRMLTAPDGTHHKPYAPQFYRDPTPEETKTIGPFAGSGCGSGLMWSSRDWDDGQGYRTKVSFVPEDWTESEFKVAELMTFREYVADQTDVSLEVPHDGQPDKAGRHGGGWTELAADGTVARVVDRTNPNKKWDWWVVGGRYSARLRVLPGRETYLAERDARREEPGWSDVCRLGDLDADYMRDSRGRKAGERWDLYRAIVGDEPEFTPFATYRERHGDDLSGARAEYHAQPIMRRLANHPQGHQFSWDEPTELLVPRQQFVDEARRGALSTYALLVGGTWHQRGEMGWFGMSSNEEPQESWDARFDGLVLGLPPSSWLTVVDCHI